MLRRALIPFALAAAFLCVSFSARPPSAWADTPGDAGVDATAGSAAPAAEQPAEAAPECTYKGQPLACSRLAEQFNSSPTDAVSTVRHLWKDGAVIPAVLLALFAIVYSARKRFAWLAQGKRAAWTSSALGGLTILAEPASRGTTPTASMFIAALGAAFLLFTNTTGGTTPVSDPPG